MPVAIIGAAVVISIAMNLLKPPPLKAESPDTALVVKTQLLQAADANLSVQSQGTVLPRTRTLLTSEVSGTVLHVSPQFVVGGTFKAGDLLLQIDPTDYKVALQRANANLISMNAQLTFERARATQAEKEWAMTGRPAEEAPLLALRKPYLEEARANVLQAEAEVTQAQLKLERTAIRVPYTGMVSTKAVDIGQYVSVGTNLGETFAIDFAEVRLPLTKRDLSMMNSFSQADREHHLQVTLLGSAHGTEKRWDARLVRSEGVIDKVNRSLYVVAQVDDPYARNSGDRTNANPLLMGTFVTAIIDGKSIANVFAVPRHALLEGSKIALVDDDQRLRLKSIEPIYADKQFYYLSRDIDEGIDDGAEIIVSTIGVPIEGMKVAAERTKLAAIVPEAPRAQGALFDGE
ncbi:MAG: efflux RND transporter periplasmic adaptor subunit [Porticoccaceae bacterium]|nr:efflux RND transporter periplasmic adaptor subunit [Porticoccaceae bacterium]MDG1486065.1 efflux RND transporter periplasmic adaptor subunit [Porticoccaceae bacterium]